MADPEKTLESTHRYRNIIDDALDFLLAVIAFAYLMFHEQLDITLTEDQLVMAAAFGASARISLRKILMRMWGDKLPSAPHVDPPAAESAAADEGGNDDSGDAAESAPASFKPPPKTDS
jgi:hypothetical protein